MIQPFRQDLEARRRVPFPWRGKIVGLNAADVQDLRMSIRLRKDELGDPLLYLPFSETWGAENAVSKRADPLNAGDTQFRIEIGETTMEGFPTSAELGGAAGQDVRLVYDMQILTPSLPRSVLMEGSFTILAGVTL